MISWGYELLVTYNNSQLEAINSNDERIVCVACPGSGKTTVLLGRIQRLINDGVDPTSILGITFTNTAAVNMLDRFKRDNPYLHTFPEFKTFHAFCYSLILNDIKVREKLGYNSIPKVADDVILKKLESKAKSQCGTKLTKEQIQGTGSYLSLKEKKEYEIYHKALNKLIKSENYITFDIMCNEVCNLFTSDDPSIQYYKQKYKYICCDEYQDTSAIQFKLIASFPKGTHWFIVGDPEQLLYSFTGCTNALLKMLIDSPDFTKIRLTENYRSTNQICKFANNFSKNHFKKEYCLPMTGTKDGDSVRVEGFCYPSYAKPLDDDHINMLITELKDTNEETAILCRTNREVEYITKRLQENGIACNNESAKSDIPDILRCCVDNGYMLDYLSSFLSQEQYSEYIRLSSLEPNPDIKWFSGLYGNVYEINRKGNCIIGIRKILISKGSDANKCSKILAKFGIVSDAKDFNGSGTSDIISYVTETSKSSVPNSVTVQTIHKSKGLEYSRVYVVNVDTKTFKLDDEDEFCCYFVAITRAKNHLIIFTR